MANLDVRAGQRLRGSPWTDLHSFDLSPDELEAHLEAWLRATHG